MKLIISAPASIANLGSGFDTFGLAINLRNEIEIESSNEFSITEEGLHVEGEDLFEKVFKDVLEKEKMDLRYKIKKRTMIPPQKGLGSSAAAIIMGLAAGMELASAFSRQKIFEIASEIEGHSDNVAASVFGGFTASALFPSGYKCAILAPMCTELTIVIPPFSTSTPEARKVLPKAVSLEDAVFNLQRAVMVVANLKDKMMLKEFFEDKLHQDVRLALHPELKSFFEKTKAKVKDPIFLCGSGTAIGVMGNHRLKVPNGWQILHKTTSTEGIIVRHV